MRKIFIGLALAVLLNVFPGAAWAEDLSAEKRLSAEEQREIGLQLQSFVPEGVVAYDQTKLQLSNPLPVYAYTDEGFVQIGRYLPLLFNGEPAFFIVEHENGYGVDFSMRNWWVKNEVMADKPLALVWDYDSCYYFDGTDWLLLHKSVDVHYKNDDYAVLDINQPIDTSGLLLTTLRPVQALDSAFPERLPRVAPRADEDLSIYLDGEKLAIEGWLHKERVLLPLRDICDMLGVPVDYTDSTQRITLRQGRHVYSLRLNEREVLRDGNLTAGLDVPAQEKNGRTYLPLRFVAQLFDLNLQWDEENLRVDMERLEQPVVKVVRHVRMTNETWDMHLNTPRLAQQMYDELLAACFDEVEAPLPENLGYYPNLDNPDFYYQVTSFDFLQSDGSIYANYELYVHVPGQPLPEDGTEYLVCIDGSWYITLDELPDLLDVWYNIDGWQRVD